MSFRWVMAYKLVIWLLLLYCLRGKSGADLLGATERQLQEDNSAATGDGFALLGGNDGAPVAKTELVDTVVDDILRAMAKKKQASAWVKKVGIPKPPKKSKKKKLLCVDFRFATPLALPLLAGGLSGIAIGDFNRDKLNDLVACSAASDVVTVLLNVGHERGFTAARRYPVGPPGSFPLALRLGDFNGDGRLDVVTANSGLPSVSLLLGRGDGSFANSAVFSTGHGVGPIDLAVGDFNLDKCLDVAVVHPKPPMVTILFGNGIGGFGLPINLPLPKTIPLSILAVDLDLDFADDVVVGMAEGLTVIRSLGDGSWRLPQFTKIPSKKPVKVLDIALGFFDPNKIPDLATADGPANTMSVLLGRGDGTFWAVRSYSVLPGLLPTALVVADLNNDWLLDIVTANSKTNDLTLFQGLGNGYFQFIRTYPLLGSSTVGGPMALAAGWLNEDIRVDLAAASFGSDVVTVLKNACPLKIVRLMVETVADISNATLVT